MYFHNRSICSYEPKHHVNGEVKRVEGGAVKITQEAQGITQFNKNNTYTYIMHHLFITPSGMGVKRPPVLQI
jgi:hypothetical protein